MAGHRGQQQGTQDGVQSVGKILLHQGSKEAHQIAGHKAGQDTVAAHGHAGHHSEHRVGSHADGHQDGGGYAAHAPGHRAGLAQKRKAHQVTGNIFVDRLHQEGGYCRIGQAGHGQRALGCFHAEEREAGQRQQEQAHPQKDRRHNLLHLHESVGLLMISICCT